MRQSARRNSIVMLIVLGALIVFWLFNWPRYMRLDGWFFVAPAIGIWLVVLFRFLQSIRGQGGPDL